MDVGQQEVRCGSVPVSFWDIEGETASLSARLVAMAEEPLGWVTQATWCFQEC